MAENLEEDFKTLVERVSKEIKEKVSLASKILSEAEALSDKHGVPFYGFGISGVSQSYTPSSVESLTDEQKEILEGICDYVDYDNANGWEHSAVCY